MLSLFCVFTMLKDLLIVVYCVSAVNLTRTLYIKSFVFNNEQSHYLSTTIWEMYSSNRPMNFYVAYWSVTNLEHNYTESPAALCDVTQNGPGLVVWNILTDNIYSANLY